MYPKATEDAPCVVDQRLNNCTPKVNPKFETYKEAVIHMFMWTVFEFEFCPYTRCKKLMCNPMSNTPTCTKGQFTPFWQ